MLYGYCVRVASDPPPGVEVVGIDEGPVRSHLCGELAVWVSEVEDLISPSEERLRQHDRVVRDALRTATPLPLRFGTVFATSDALGKAIEARRETFRRALDRVAGLVEMVIRVERRDGGGEAPGNPPASAEDNSGEAATSGREYLQRRRAQLEARESARRKAEEILREIGGKLGELAIDTSISPALEADLVGRVACLVRREDVPAFRIHIAGAIQTGWPELRLGVTGPWAPYSFANE